MKMNHTLINIKKLRWLEPGLILAGYAVSGGEGLALYADRRH